MISGKPSKERGSEAAEAIMKESGLWRGRLEVTPRARLDKVSIAYYPGQVAWQLHPYRKVHSVSSSSSYFFRSSAVMVRVGEC